MNKFLEKLSHQIHITTNDLIKGYEAWLMATHEEKDLYHQNRLNLIQTYNGVFYDQGVLCKTSGSSLGLHKKYKWGPNFDAMFNFWEFICFGDLDFDTTLSIFFKFDVDIYTVLGPNPVAWYKNYTVVLSPTESNFAKLNELLQSNNKSKIILKIIPSQFEILLKKQSLNLKQDFVDKIIFHSTGEILSDFLRNFFKENNWKIRDTMRIWNGGAGFYTCKHDNIHWDNFTSTLQIIGDELYSTDLYNLSQLFFKIKTGDKLQIIEKEICPCGLRIQKNIWQEKITTFCHEDKIFTWMELRNDFVKSYAKIYKIDNLDICWDNILGLSVGVSKRLFKVDYETKNPIDSSSIKALEQILKEKWKIEVLLSPGLKHSQFKTSRIYQLKTQHLL